MIYVSVRVDMDGLQSAGHGHQHNAQQRKEDPSSSTHPAFCPYISHNYHYYSAEWRESGSWGRAGATKS